MKKFNLLMATLLASFLVIWLSVETWSFYRFVTQPLNVEVTAQPQSIVISEGSSTKQVAQILYENKIMHNPRWFVWVVKFKGQSQALKAGELLISPRWTLDELIEALVAGKTVQYPATLIAGKTVAENIALLQQLNPALVVTQEDVFADLQKSIAVPHLEGQFLPETYYYSKNETLLSVFQRAHAALNHVLEQTWQNCETDLPIKTAQEMLILASIVEKETGQASERATIAGVFMNRLNIGMRLQSDPTIIYGMGEDYKGKIRKKDILTKTEYNTYRINGLPPTPIALASRQSIEAVCHPEKTKAFYFVAKGQGLHQFSETLAEHNQAIRTYILSQ